ncbi:MAG: protein kinase [Deltaproteobacteria bacterium]|nr:protein kinase [Deltaproteobacteria bacterium]
MRKATRLFYNPGLPSVPARFGATEIVGDSMEYQRFGKHILLERIAAGGMAEVFKAKAFGVEGFEKVLAIKRILPHVASDKAFIEMFINEAKILSALSHSSVCQIFDLGQADGAFFITMEYVSGKSLQTILQLFRKHGRTMPLTMAAFVISRVCEGLDYVYHKVGLGGQPLRIVHRDVSPHNILVGHEGTVKLIDFGIAHARTASESGRPTTSQKLQGKFDYMSPEQVAGENVDHRSDVFAVGVCLYELATNRHPFTGNTEFNTLENIRKLSPPPASTINPDCTAELDAIIQKSIEKMPSKRWERTGDLMEALQRYIVSKPPLFNATSLSQFMRRTFARDIEEERKKGEAYASVKIDGAGAADDAATAEGLSTDLLAEMARVASARAADASASMSAPTVPPPPPPQAQMPAPPRGPAGKRTMLGMPAVGQLGQPAARPVARPIGPPPAPPSAPVRRAISTVPPATPPPRPSAPPPPAPPRFQSSARPALRTADLAGKAAVLHAVPAGGEQKVVAIPTKTGFPAVQAPAPPAPSGPSENDLDFDEDEAPTAVLDDKLASIVRTLAGADAPKTPSVPPPLPIVPPGGGPDDQPIGFDVQPPQHAMSDVYEVEPVARRKPAAAPHVAQPRKKSSVGLAIAIAVAIVAAGVIVILVLSRSGGTSASKDAAPIVALVDAGASPGPQPEPDAGSTTPESGAPAPDSSAVALAEADAAPDVAAPPDAAPEAAAEAEPEAAPEAAPDASAVALAEADEVTLVAIGPTPDAGEPPPPEEDTVSAPPDRDAGTTPPRDSGRERDTAAPRDTSRERDTSGGRDTATERDTSRPPPTGDTGKLSVIANPWAWVSIDGRDTNRKTPLVNYELSTGVHRVCLRTEDGREHCTAVRITTDQPARVVHNF